ncbi:ammonium transporter [Methanofervidicoccus sp. A16]|uniref:ammonium transporter n=1 Tax=Methanofervidicoccus sp. A16 TaxID=2607662 RepID=UPI00118CB8AE|nr:ammonium transporter [Methanofervidicoccus sp. A16]AXI24792.1 ammonium transporter [Methanofervidicoccus sp. A16]MBW9220351.1 ammonium transporter [Methanothermococcus sp. SCGC AD-155-N22]MBW9220452.1 ammonium transporter [Methanothermococcus sp. SCGC AD-155-N22]
MAEMNITEALTQLMTAGDIFFLVVMGVLVFLMQLGFAMLEGGQVRSKNVNNVMMKNMVDWLVGCVSWLFIGYILCTSLNPGDFIAWWGKIFSAAPFLENNGLELANWFFGLVFAATAATIVSGGVAERIRFSAYVLISILITAFLYPFFVYLGPWGASIVGWHDYAGSLIVHGLGGFLALGAIAALGPRKGRFKDGKPVPILGHNIPMAVFGAFALAIGWYGFNVGSALALQDISGLVCATTTLAMAGGGIGALIASKKDVLFTANGLVAGLVAICAGTDIVSPIGGLIIGLIAGAQVPLVYRLLENMKLDDVCGVVPVHGTAGVIGAILAGIFGMTALGGTGDVNIVSQIVASIFCIVYGVALGYIIAKVVGVVTGGLRVSEEEEEIGLDLTEHKLPAYPEEEAA